MGLEIVNEADDVVEENDSWHLQSVLGNSGGNSMKQDTRLIFRTLKSIQQNNICRDPLDNDQLLCLINPRLHDSAGFKKNRLHDLERCKNTTAKSILEFIPESLRKGNISKSENVELRDNLLILQDNLQQPQAEEEEKEEILNAIEEIKEIEDVVQDHENNQDELKLIEEPVAPI